MLVAEEAHVKMLAEVEKKRREAIVEVEDLKKELDRKLMECSQTKKTAESKANENVQNLTSKSHF